MNPFADIGAEKSVIGAVLQDSTCLRLLDQLRPEDFTCPEYSEIWNAVSRLNAKRENVDMQTVFSELGQLGEIITPAVLLDAIRYTPTTANADSYAKIVREKSRKREVKQLCENAIAMLAEADADVVVDTALDGMRGMLGGGNNRISFGEIASRTYDMLAAVAKGEIKSIPTPLLDLNYYMNGGLRKGEVTVLAAYTGQGKSALALEIARNAARKGFRSLLVSREMGPEQYGMRAFSSISGIGVDEMWNAAKLQPDQWVALADAMNEMQSLPIEVTDRVATVEDVRREVRRMKSIDLLVIDYLQILRTREKFPNDNSRVSHISRIIKEIALDMQIPVLLLSQFSRPPKGSQQRPKVSDLRDSGSIEQDADNIWLMWQPVDDNDPDIPVGYQGWCQACEDMGDRFLLLDVAKQRMGRTGILGVQFAPKQMRFLNPLIEGG